MDTVSVAMTKQQAAELFLAMGEMQITLDARQPGVIVPPPYHLHNALVLAFSHKYASPEIVTNSWGIRATLEFTKQRWSVAVPWEAAYVIFSLVSGKAWEWPAPAEPVAAVKQRGGLRLV
jgi:stringent starvation protein B